MLDWIVILIGFKLAWILIEFGFLMVIFILCVSYVFIKHMSESYRQKKCKHTNFYETQSCDLVCCDCGKNFGFIGSFKNKGLIIRN